MEKKIHLQSIYQQKKLIGIDWNDAFWLQTHDVVRCLEKHLRRYMVLIMSFSVNGNSIYEFKFVNHE